MYVLCRPHLAQQYAITDDGVFIQTDRDPIPLNPIPRSVYYSICHGTPFGRYRMAWYDIIKNKIIAVDLPLSMTIKVDLHTLMDKRLHHLMTSTTPFYLTATSIRFCARSYLWTVTDQRRVSKIRLLPRGVEQYFTRPHPPTVVINILFYSVYYPRSNFAFGSNIAGSQYSIDIYPESFEIIALQHLRSVLMRDTTTNNIYFRNGTRYYQVDNHYEVYGLFHSDVFVIDNGRLVTLEQTLIESNNLQSDTIRLDDIVVRTVR